MSVAKRVPCLQWMGVLNGTMPDVMRFSAQYGLVPFLVRIVDAYLRGASQVVVVNNPVAGIFILLGICFPSPLVGVHGCLGLLGATVTAFLLQLDPHAISSGLFGYNGLLVGMAMATFLTRDGADAGILVASVLLGSLTTVINLSLGNCLVPTFKTPPFTLAFNITMLLMLLASKNMSHFAMPHHSSTPAATPAAEEESAELVNVSWLLRVALVGVGQVFLCDSAISGALILAGMAVSSRIAALSAFVGSLASSAMALALGIDRTSIGHGLWGYNSTLTAIVVFTFYVPSLKGGVMCAIGVGLTVLIDAAMRTSFALVQMPVGTLPFCAAAILVVLAHEGVAGFVPVPISDVSTAEDHLYSARVTKITQIANGTVLPSRAADGATGSKTGREVERDVNGALADDDASGSFVGALPRSGLRTVELAEVTVEEPQRAREALIYSPRQSPLQSRGGSRAGSRGGSQNNSMHGHGCFGGMSSSRGNSVHGERRFKTLHNGSHHGERYVARKLARLADGSTEACLACLTDLADVAGSEGAPLSRLPDASVGSEGPPQKASEGLRRSVGSEGPPQKASEGLRRSVGSEGSPLSRVPDLAVRSECSTCSSSVQQHGLESLSEQVEDRV